MSLDVGTEMFRVVEYWCPSKGESFVQAAAEGDAEKCAEFIWHGVSAEDVKANHFFKFGDVEYVVYRWRGVWV